MRSARRRGWMRSWRATTARRPRRCGGGRRCIPGRRMGWRRGSTATRRPVRRTWCCASPASTNGTWRRWRGWGGRWAGCRRGEQVRRGRPWAGSGRCVAGRAARSGRAGGCRGVGGGQVRAGGWRGFGMVLAIRPVRQVLEQGGEIAAVADDGDASSRHSGWLGRMPRSRQMSARTAPIGRRRASAAICSSVGIAGGARGRVAAAPDGRRGAGHARVGAGRAWGRRPRRAAVRTTRASSSWARWRPRRMRARICRDVAGAEGAGVDSGGGAGAGLLEGGGELLAVVDELADEVEEALGAGRGVPRGVELGSTGWSWWRRRPDMNEKRT